jgi:hypothetical protein
MGRDLYDPYTMRVKDIGELVPELHRLIMGKLPGGPVVSALWGAFCEASREYKEAHDEIEQCAGGELPTQLWRAHGQQYTAAKVIRKIADGLGVSNFTLREVSGAEGAIGVAEQG